VEDLVSSSLSLYPSIPPSSKKHPIHILIMLSLLFLVASLASTSLSAPTQTVHEQGELAWSPLFSDFYSAVSHHIALIKEQPNFPNPPPCDLSKAVMPAAITPLPVPGPGQVLRHVAIGRGTQVTTTPLPCIPLVTDSSYVELHLLRQLPNHSPCLYRSCGLPLQRLLHRRHLSRPASHASQYCPSTSNPSIPLHAP
jgi:hypothetical protein